MRCRGSSDVSMVRPRCLAPACLQRTTCWLRPQSLPLARSCTCAPPYAALPLARIPRTQTARRLPFRLPHRRCCCRYPCGRRCLCSGCKAAPRQRHAGWCGEMLCACCVGAVSLHVCTCKLVNVRGSWRGRALEGERGVCLCLCARENRGLHAACRCGVAETGGQPSAGALM